MNPNIDKQQSKPKNKKQKVPPKSYYPVSFPYPHCWFKTIILLFSFTFIIFLLRIIGVITGTGIVVMIELSEDPQKLTFTILFWLISLCLVFPVFVLAHIYQFLWSDRNPNLPKWMPNYRSLGEGVWGWFVSICAFLIGALMVFEFAPNSFSSSYVNSELSDTQATILSIAWVFTSAYLYHFRRLIYDSFSWPKKVKRK